MRAFLSAENVHFTRLYWALCFWNSFPACYILYLPISVGVVCVRQRTDVGYGFSSQLRWTAASAVCSVRVGINAVCCELYIIFKKYCVRCVSAITCFFPPDGYLRCACCVCVICFECCASPVSATYRSVFFNTFPGLRRQFSGLRASLIIRTVDITNHQALVRTITTPIVLVCACAGSRQGACFGIFLLIFVLLRKSTATPSLSLSPHSVTSTHLLALSNWRLSY